ncbi:MAG: hypothetical protein H0T48_08270 [Gemmatimonadaceae bacterium]|nr:hypothetical protein [Gemmatimonadaceae bacterium]
MPRSSAIKQRKLWRPAILILAVAQMTLALAPLLDGRRGGGAEAHVEAAGIVLHHAHDDSSCFACIARSILSSSNLAERTTYEVRRDVASPRIAAAARVRHATNWQLPARAPPGSVA